MDEPVDDPDSPLAVDASRELPDPLGEVDDPLFREDGLDELHPELSVVHRVGHRVEPLDAPPRQPAHPEVLLRELAGVEALLEPGEHAAHADAVEAGRVSPAVQLLGRPLVEDPAQRAHRLVGLVVLLVLVAHLLADGCARLAARRLLLLLDGLLVELLEVVIHHELLVELEPRVLGLEDGAVVEGEETAPKRGIVHSEGAARREFRVEAVLRCALEVLGRQALLVLCLEPLVGHFAVAEVLVDEGAAEDDGGDAVVLKHVGAHAAAAGPGVHARELALRDGRAPDGPEVGGERRRPHGEHPRVGREAAPEAFQDLLHQPVDAAAPARPGSSQVHGDDLDVDLLAVVAVQVEDRRDRRLAGQAHHVDPEVVEHEPSAAH